MQNFFSLSRVCQSLSRLFGSNHQSPGFPVSISRGPFSSNRKTDASNCTKFSRNVDLNSTSSNGSFILFCCLTFIVDFCFDTLKLLYTFVVTPNFSPTDFLFQESERWVISADAQQMGLLKSVPLLKANFYKCFDFFRYNYQILIIIDNDFDNQLSIFLFDYRCW